MRVRVLATAAALAVAAVGCSAGGLDGTAAPTPPTGEAPPPAADGTVTFVGTANLQWARTEKSATLADGPLEVTIECEGAVPHNVAFEGAQGDAVIAECSGDDVGTGTIDVESGTYTYYCAIPGHRTAGMEGTITIS